MAIPYETLLSSYNCMNQYICPKGIRGKKCNHRGNLTRVEKLLKFIGKNVVKHAVRVLTKAQEFLIWKTMIE